MLAKITEIRGSAGFRNICSETSAGATRRGLEKKSRVNHCNTLGIETKINVAVFCFAEKTMIPK